MGLARALNDDDFAAAVRLFSSATKLARPQRMALERVFSALDVGGLGGIEVHRADTYLWPMELWPM